MTATPEVGFAAAVLSKTQAVFLEHYSKLLTGLIAAFSGWALVYGTAWIGALPVPQPPPPPPAAPTIVREDSATVAKLDAIESALQQLREDMKARTTKKGAAK